MDVYKIIDTVVQILTLERGEYAIALARFEAAKENFEISRSSDDYVRAEERYRTQQTIWGKLQELEQSLPPRETFPLAWLVRPIAVDRVKKAALEKKIAETEAAIAAIEKEHSWKWAAAAKGPKRVSPLVVANQGILEVHQEALKKLLVSLEGRETILKKHVENMAYIDALSIAAKGEGPLPPRYLAEQEATRQAFLKENPAWVPTGPYASERLTRLSVAKNMAAAF